MTNYFQHWLASSSWLGWCLANPVLSIGILLLAIFLLSGLFKAVGRWSEWVWLFLFSLPWKVIQPTIDTGWRVLARGVRGDREYKIVRKNSIVGTQTRIRQVIQRLIEIEKEQSLLLVELQHLIGISEENK